MTVTQDIMGKCGKYGKMRKMPEMQKMPDFFTIKLF